MKLSFRRSFIERYLNKNNMISEKASFAAKFSELQSNHLTEIRYKIRGKDFIELIAWYIKPYLSRKRLGFLILRL
jgi:hypothetical protein